MTAQPIRRSQKGRQRGVTLLESLVSILILAVGVLAILWVQVRTLAETQTSARRTQAVRAIEDLGERIKSNPDAFAQLNAYVTDWDIGDAPGADCRAQACTTAQLAARDLWEWKTEVAQRLPLGKAAVFLSSDEEANNKRQLGVMVAWRSNERSDDKGYTAPLAQPAPASAGIPSCPAGLICHVVYVQP
ncbi:type IV pilus modification protein PilV [Variovorax robiniae]|uniref:Type IV pilus modification protein PilV n=1 Tax=Variovorax robiniae TaxID=1836199 RepID=A0ABU8X9W0_9BURK